jgi:hypothetical protein
MENKFMLGNYIHPLLDENEIAEICYIGEDGFGYERLSDEEYFQGNSIKPIIITEEWLLMLGFEKTKRKVNYKDECVYFHEESFMYWIFKYDLCLCFLDKDLEYCSYSNVDVKYVHQLQNLYFALTNEELIII